MKRPMCVTVATEDLRKNVTMLVTVTINCYNRLFKRDKDDLPFCTHARYPTIVDT